jgi:dTDP-4-dehydrorhamnose reductase
MLFKRIIVTGANGLLGQSLVARLASFPEYDLLATGRQEEPAVPDAAGGYQSLDITRASDVRRLFEDFAPDVVVNCAAMTNVDACEGDKKGCWRVNVDAVESMARHCLSTGASLVQVSTDFVFDGENGPYRESVRPRPINFYGKSKLAGENAARGAGLDRWSVVRTVLTYGTGRNLPRTDFVRWVVRELGSGRAINVVTDQMRTPTYAPDLAAGIERLIRFGKTGTYHVSGGEVLSVFDFAHRVARAFQLDPLLIRPISTASLGLPAPRPLRSGFLILKAQSELGYRPTELDQTLAEVRSALSESTA